MSANRNPNRDIRLVQLRRQFPTIPFDLFRECLGLVTLETLNDEGLLEFLRELEEKALAEERKRQTELEQVRRKLEAHIQSLVAREPHRGLNFPAESGVDLEHAQAIIAYGFSFTGTSQRIYAGSNKLPKRHVRVNVKRKLAERYRDDLFNGALAYLVRHGVVMRSPQVLDCFSLNLDERASLVTEAGKEMIKTMKTFLFARLANGGGE